MDKLDRKILNILQDKFPLSACPYKDLASDLGVSEDEVLQRVQTLKNDGIIRRIGAIMDSRKMGYYSTLCTCQVEEERIDEIAEIINLQKGITHNYIRDHKYNIWFTLTAPSHNEADKIIHDIERAAGISVLTMPARRMYKIKVSLNMGDHDED